MQGFYTMPSGINPGAASSLWLETPGPPQQHLFGPVTTDFAHMGIPIAIPAPGAGALLLAVAGLCLRTRKRPI